MCVLQQYNRLVHLLVLHTERRRPVPKINRTTHTYTTHTGGTRESPQHRVVSHHTILQQPTAAAAVLVIMNRRPLFIPQHKQWFRFEFRTTTNRGTRMITSCSVLSVKSKKLFSTIAEASAPKRGGCPCAQLHPTCPPMLVHFHGGLSLPPVCRRHVFRIRHKAVSGLVYPTGAVNERPSVV